MTDPYAGTVPEPEETVHGLTPEAMARLAVLIRDFTWDAVQLAMFDPPLWAIREQQRDAGRSYR